MVTFSLLLSHPQGFGVGVGQLGEGVGTGHALREGIGEEDGEGTGLDVAEGAELDEAEGAELDEAEGAELDEAEGAELDEAEGAELEEAEGTELEEAEATDVGEGVAVATLVVTPPKTLLLLKSAIHNLWVLVSMSMSVGVNLSTAGPLLPTTPRTSEALSPLARFSMLNLRTRLLRVSATQRKVHSGLITAARGTLSLEAVEPDVTVTKSV